MKHTPIIILATLLLLSCGNRKGGDYEETYDGGHGVGVDTAAIHIIQCQEEKANEPMNENSRAVAPSPSTYSSEDQEPDNMRGFDPASEDDMDDNGMTRYMEVNDEEGWD